jgi:hypothetical protein
MAGPSGSLPDDELPTSGKSKIFVVIVLVLSMNAISRRNNIRKTGRY